MVWSLIGLWRWGSERLSSSHVTLNNASKATAVPDKSAAAICVPAHNEEIVLEKTLLSLIALTEPRHIYVVSDGSIDRTASLARQYDCQVLEIAAAQGKATALTELIRHFSLFDRYDYLMIADADTTFEPHFLDNALRLLAADPRLAAVFGYCYTSADAAASSGASFFRAFRIRLWGMLQPLLTYGQAWSKTNVYPVIPGFANVYRSSVLRQLVINVPGSVIEDFNLAFQIHKRQLGTISVHPSLIAFTQDPSNLTDYWRQVWRWNLGLFQAVRRWGVWPSLFWVSLAVYIAEYVLIALGGLLIPAMSVFFFLVALPGGVSWQDPALRAFLVLGMGILVLSFIVDYAITLLIALVFQDKKLPLFGLGFFFLHYVNSLIFLAAIPAAFLVSSDGRWLSPQRWK